MQTPIDVLLARIADLEARLQLADEAYFYLLAEVRALESGKARKENHP